METYYKYVMTAMVVQAPIMVNPEGHKLCNAAESLLHSVELTCPSCPHMLHMHPGISAFLPPLFLSIHSSNLPSSSSSLLSPFLTLTSPYTGFSADSWGSLHYSVVSNRTER